LTPRILEQLFELIEKETVNGSGIEYLLKCSNFEIYNEKVKDLLNPTSN
jgi:Kinesin motor domain